MVECKSWKLRFAFGVVKRGHLSSSSGRGTRSTEKTSALAVVLAGTLRSGSWSSLQRLAVSVPVVGKPIHASSLWITLTTMEPSIGDESPKLRF